MNNMLAVGIGGFIGAVLRYIVSILSSKLFGTGFPHGTLVVNVIGGLLIGIIMELSIKTTVISPTLRLFLTTGILGGLTTFSTFSYETVGFVIKGSLGIAAVNTLLNVSLSFLGVWLGRYLVIIK